MSERVEIFEVGPRDGLQNEPGEISVDQKVELIDCLSAAGFVRIEVASFVSPRWVPQMAGSSEVLARIQRVEGVSYAALTPNMRGFEDAMVAGADEVAIFGSASEGFSRANINASIAESLERFAPVAEAARVRGVPLRGYVSCVTDCPFDGAVDPGQVAKVATELFEMGCYEISLGDTLGQGKPERVEAMLGAVTQAVPATKLAGHFHDTAGRALENIEVALGHGLRVFDAAVGGLGGCPHAPGAKGNVATEAVHDRLIALGYETGLDRAVLTRAAKMARAMRKQPENGSGMYETLEITREARGVATLWLDREAKHNAMSAQMIAELHCAAGALGGDEGVRVVVLAAKGRTFCAGGDLGWMREQFEAEPDVRAREAGKLAYMLQALNTLPKPLIARVEGNAFGGGVGLVSVCDVAIGTDAVQMALTETRLGLIPATIGPYVCARMGEAKARRVFMSARRFGASEAVRLGLLARAVPEDEMDAAIEAEVAPYLDCAPGAVAQAKALLRSFGPPVDEAVIAQSIAALSECWAGNEAQEGIAAFFDKRKPGWASNSQ